MAWGFMRCERLDYLDTFSPIPVPSSIRMMASTVLQRHWTLNLCDIEQAFVLSRIDRESSLRLPGVGEICLVEQRARVRRCIDYANLRAFNQF